VADSITKSQRSHWVIVRHCWAIFACALILLFAFCGAPAWAVPGELPVVQQGNGVTPDWEHISFADLPVMDFAGTIDLPDDLDLEDDLDYRLSRTWQAGDSAASVLKLGDLQDGFGLETFRLGDAVRLGGVDANALSLENFQEILENQSIASLVDRLPTIGNHKLSEVQPLYDLVARRLPTFQFNLPEITDSITAPIQQFQNLNNLAFWQDQTISSIVSDQFGSQLGWGLSLNEINPSNYTFTQLPGLDQAQIQNIPGWRNLSVAQIPGLAGVPFAAFNAINTIRQFLGIIAIHDVTYGGDQEHKESRQTATKFSITGSNVVGFRYQCRQPKGCDYIELESPIKLGALGDPRCLHGARWIRGGRGKGEQMVRGGSGILGILNGGLEPTGRHPFGNVFKVVLVDTDESTGTGRFGLYFRVCRRRPINLGCTPYFIGPIPWFPTKEKGIVLVGMTPQTPPSNIPAPSIPPEVQAILDQHGGTAGDESGEGINAASSECAQKAIAQAPAGDRSAATEIIPLLLAEAQRAGIRDPRQIAYILASVQAESNFRPRTEDGSSCNQYGSGCYQGRGLIQVTHDYNYRYWSRRLNIDLMQNPDLANRTDIAVKIAVLGMKDGTFTGMTAEGELLPGGGRKLSDFINKLDGGSAQDVMMEK
jgi:hypothetical protein